MKAFPQKYPQDPGRPWSQLANPVDSGMDLRDYFAGQVISGLLNEANGDFNDQAIAELAYSIADAMMKARNDS